MKFERRIARLEAQGAAPQRPHSTRAEEIREIDRAIAALGRQIALEESLMTPDELAAASLAARDLDSRLAGLSADEKITLLEAELDEK